MKSTQRLLHTLMLSTMILIGTACNLAGQAPLNVDAQTQGPPGNSSANPATPVTAPAVVPTSSYPPDWESYSSDTPKLALFLPPGWSVTSSTLHMDIHPPSGYAWVEIDWLSPDNPGLAGEPIVESSDFSQLGSQVEQALKENGTFEPSQTFVTSGGASAWTIQGHHDSFNDNIVVALVKMNATTIQFIGHQGDTSEDWENLKAIYMQIVQSLAL